MLSSDVYFYAETVHMLEPWFDTLEFACFAVYVGFPQIPQSKDVCDVLTGHSEI